MWLVVECVSHLTLVAAKQAQVVDSIALTIHNIVVLMIEIGQPCTKLAL